MSDDSPRAPSAKPLGRKPAGPTKRAVRALVEKLLVVYYVGTDPATPGWAKAILVAGVASFFSIDLLLDVFALPVGAEFSVGSFVLALGAFVFSIRRRHFERARRRADEWFGEDDGTVITVTAVPVDPPAPPSPDTKPPLLPKP